MSQCGRQWTYLQDVTIPPLNSCRLDLLVLPVQCSWTDENQLAHQLPATVFPDPIKRERWQLSHSIIVVLTVAWTQSWIFDSSVCRVRLHSRLWRQGQLWLPDGCCSWLSSGPGSSGCLRTLGVVWLPAQGRWEFHCRRFLCFRFQSDSEGLLQGNRF